MKIDLLKYKQTIEPLRGFLKVNSNLSFNDKMTNYSVATHIPLIVVAYYIIKIEKWIDCYKLFNIRYFGRY